MLKEKLFFGKHGIGDKMTNINTTEKLFGYASKKNAIDFSFQITIGRLRLLTRIKMEILLLNTTRPFIIKS